MAAAFATPVALAACDIDPPRDETPEQGESDAPLPQDDDTGLVATVLDRIEETRGVVATVASAPVVVALASRLRALHSAQTDLLGEALPDQEPKAGAPGGETTPVPEPGPPRRTLLAAERRLQRELVRAAGQASSGDLARVLASAAAAVAQELAADVPGAVAP
jgi:hypothetical protein